MSKYLVVVESPTKARTLTRFLGSKYKIEASMGHVRDLPQKGGGLAIDIEHDFAPQYEVISGKQKVVTQLKKLAQESEEIYLATDPDREGEAIAYHVQYLLENGGKKSKSKQVKFSRVTFHEITQTAIEAALAHPGKINLALVQAQQARRVLDRLVGYTLSPVLWRKVRRGLSAGRVQSVAVRLIVEKEQEIASFQAEEYWEIYADLLKPGVGDKKQESIRTELVKIAGKQAKIDSEAVAKKIVQELEQAKYSVSNVTQEEQHSSPYPPFTTSLLQRAGSNLWGWSAKQTMAAAQALYEHGLITYHRTDSYNLAAEAITAAREWISNTWGAKYLPETARYYKTKAKSAQEAHEAIRPTEVARTEIVLEGKLESKHNKLYQLIRNRFLQCQMSDAVFDKTTIIVDAGEYTLKAEGKRLLFEGYLVLGKQADDVFVPELKAGEELELEKVESEQKFTQPPARYSEAGLIKELEKRGIGRPSTYAAIISTIQDRNYVVKEEKRFVPTAVGVAVTEFLLKNFADVMAYEFTARMEDDLDLIAEGKKEWVPTVREFWVPFDKKSKQVGEKGERVKVPVESTGEKCPECKEGEVVIRTGRFGKFLSCSTYPTCKYTKQYVEYVAGYTCPECGGRVVEKKSKRGKFFGCEKYPACRWATWKLGKRD